MGTHKHKRLPILGQTIAIGLIVAFVSYMLAYGVVAAQTKPTGDLGVGGFATVQNRQEAIRLAKYPVGVPGYVPQGFERSESGIIVQRPNSSVLPMRVMQIWDSTADPSVQFVLIEDPTADGLGGSSPTVIGVNPGQRVIEQALPDRGRIYDILALQWSPSDGETTYLLLGMLSGSLTEVELYSIAESVSR